jgi:hypothetical protein
MRTSAPGATLPRTGAARRRAALLASLASCALCLAVASASARAEVDAAIGPSFRPDGLGARTAFTFGFHLGGHEQEMPPPVSRAIVHLPAGLSIGLSGVATCPAARLQRFGATGCPNRALIGRGLELLEVQAGSQPITEQASIWAFRGPDRGGRPVFEILGQGETPLQQRTLATAQLSADRPPYGYKLTVAIPPIPTLVYEPNASILSFSLTIGAAGRRPRAHAAAAAITVPRRCPVGGFPFAASFAFEDATMASAVARVPCP